MYKLISDINALLNEEQRVNGYFAVVASTQTSKKFFDEHAHFKRYPSNEKGAPLYHITIAYKPEMKVAETYKRYIGQKVKVKMKGLYQNDFIQAFLVSEMVFENGVKLQKRDSGPNQKAGPAHVTISWADGHSAKESNDLILQAFQSKTAPRMIAEEWTGEFVFIPSKSKA